MLTLRSITAGYGESTVLRDVDFTVGDGEVVALLGPNGAGKTTLLRTATGFVQATVRTHRVRRRGPHRPRPHKFVRRGICHLPEGRGIFPSLTVLENLTIQARTRDTDEIVAEVTELFPVLGNRLGQTAGSLSGGEQQMLALSRAYTHAPEAGSGRRGLARPGAPDRGQDLRGACASWSAQGMSLVVVEQYVQKALDLARPSTS